MGERYDYIPPQIEKLGQGIEHLDVLLSNETLGQKERYTQLLQNAQDLAHSYVGNEDQYHTLMEILSNLEQIACEAFPNSPLTPKEREELLAEAWQSNKPLITISSTIDQASEAKRLHTVATLRDRTNQKEKKDRVPQSFIHAQFNGILLPPGNIHIEPTDGTHEWTEPEFEDRVTEFLELLSTCDIYSDDCIITFGKKSRQMIRKESYAHIEIPRINKIVLICNQIGEATFVIDKYISPKTVATLTKEQLQTQYPDSVHRVIRHSADQWQAELINLLTNNIGGRNKNDTRRKKINIEKIHSYREQLLAIYPSATQWLEKRKEIKKKIEELFQIDVRQLANIFGIPNNIESNFGQYIRLGVQIYGNELSLLDALTKEKIKHEQIRHTEAAPEGWLSTKKLSDMLDVDFYTIQHIANELLSQQNDRNSATKSEWYNQYKTPNGSGLTWYYSPILVDKIKIKIEQTLPAPIGWMTCTGLANHPDIQKDIGTITSTADKILSQHGYGDSKTKSEWCKLYKAGNGRSGWHYSPELIEKIREEIEKTPLATDNWETAGVSSKKIGIGDKTFLQEADKILAEHGYGDSKTSSPWCQWCKITKIDKKTGKKRSSSGVATWHYAPELIEKIEKKMEERLPVAPTGWHTAPKLAEELDVHPQTIQNIINEVLKDNGLPTLEHDSQWCRWYRSVVQTTTGTTFSGQKGRHFAPELITQVKEYLSKKQTIKKRNPWRTTAETNEPIESPPIGWQTRNWIVSHLNSHPTTVQKKIDEILLQHQLPPTGISSRWCKLYKDDSNRPGWHYAPDLITLLTTELQAEHTPDTWLTLKQIHDKINRDPATLKNAIDTILEENNMPPTENTSLWCKWSKRETAGEKGKSRPAWRYSPEIIEKLEDFFEKAEYPPEGWETMGELAKETGLDPGILQKKLDRILTTHNHSPTKTTSNWCQRYKQKIPPGFILWHYSPELTTLLMIELKKT